MITPTPLVPMGKIQVARTLDFDAKHVGYINWQAIGDERATLNCHLAVQAHEDGGLRVTLYWVE